MFTDPHAQSGWLILFLCITWAARAQTIDTFAGDHTGDGSSAVQGYLNRPSGTAVDAAGNLYIVDTDNHRIRKVNAQDGTISTLAGNGVPGFTGDGGSAIRASFNNPLGVCIDRSGAVYIADQGNQRIRKIDPVTGIISTVAGKRTGEFSGDGGPATEANFKNPIDVAVDTAGNLFIVDASNQRIRRVDAGTGLISTVVGGGTNGSVGDGGPAVEARLNSPHAIAIATNGDIYIADSDNFRVRKVRASDGIISTVAGNGQSGSEGDGGPATMARISALGIAVDRSGNLFMADAPGIRVRKVSVEDGTISTVAGNGTYGFQGDGATAVNASLKTPTGLSTDAAGAVYFADRENNRIRKISPDGLINTVAGNGTDEYGGDGKIASSATLSSPSSVAIDRAGNVFIADGNNHRIRKVSIGTGVINTVAGNGLRGNGEDIGLATESRLVDPAHVAVDTAGNLYFTEQTHQVKKVDRDGYISVVAGSGSSGFSGDGETATAATLQSPRGLAVDAAGNLYIADYWNHRVRKVNAADGTIHTVAGNGTYGFSGDGGAATNASLSGPGALAFDVTGNLYIADRHNHRIRKINLSDNTIMTVAGNGIPAFSGDGGPATSASLYYPSGIAVSADGTLYIADVENQRVRKVSPDGIITTLAGDGTAGFGGDGGAAMAARLQYPVAVALDSTGTLYVADLGNKRIRTISQTIVSMKTGRWDDPATWNLSRKPLPNERVVVDIGHELTVDSAVKAKAIEYRAHGKLRFGGEAGTIQFEF